MSQGLCLSFCLSLCLSVSLSLCLSVSLSLCLSVSLSVCLSVSLSLCLSVSLSLCLSVSLSLCLSVSLSLCLSVSLSVCLLMSLFLFALVFAVLFVHVKLECLLWSLCLCYSVFWLSVSLSFCASVFISGTILKQNSKGLHFGQLQFYGQAQDNPDNDCQSQGSLSRNGNYIKKFY